MDAPALLKTANAPGTSATRRSPGALSATNPTVTLIPPLKKTRPSGLSCFEKHNYLGIDECGSEKGALAGTRCEGKYARRELRNTDKHG
jgi:hypothetical protein